MTTHQKTETLCVCLGRDHGGWGGGEDCVFPMKYLLCKFYNQREK